MVAAKVTAILKHGMTPIVCVGETLDEREAGATETKVLGQVDAVARRADQVDRSPRWWSPTSRSGRSAPAARRRADGCAGGVPRRSASASPSLTGARRGDAVRIQYGGSVKASNIAELMAQPDIDGALVGGASLDADEFARIVAASAELDAG